LSSFRKSAVEKCVRVVPQIVFAEQGFLVTVFP
jgi:hypothetical protein